MKKIFIPASMLILIGNVLNAQSPQKQGSSKNNLYLEFGYNYVISSISVNYERYFFTSGSEKVNLFGRAGFGATGVYWGHSGWGGFGAVTLLTGKGNNHFEASTGIFLGYEKSPPAVGGPGTVFPLPLLDLGYRFQKPGKGFIFRGKAGILGIGIGLGYAF